MKTQKGIETLNGITRKKEKRLIKKMEDNPQGST